MRSVAEATPFNQKGSDAQMGIPADPRFQAYLDNIKAKTGKTPSDFKELAERKGLLHVGVKASQIVAWLKDDFGLGHGHAMAIYAALKPSIPVAN